MKKKLFAILTVALLAMCFLLPAGCGVADNTEHYDKITKTLKLSKSFEGKQLMSSDGIGEAVLNGDTTDGDTTTFKLVEGGSYVTVRYQGVDTPESTAGVEKWGKAASVFTNERLHLATQIVLESASGGVPEKDTSGGRSLCYVWYKTEKDDFKCLNLELVENGYSKNKESATSGYYGYFQKAEKFAKGIELRLFSKLPDPLFNTEAKDFSLKAFSEHPESYSENTKVRLYAYVADKKVSSAGSVTFTVAQYDEETGNVYSIPLFAGYSDDSASNMQVGDLYHIAGTLQKHNGDWQISGVSLDNDRKGKDDWTWRSQISYCLVFNTDHSLFTLKESYNLYGNVTVSSPSLEGNTLTFTGDAIGTDEENYTFTFTVTVPEGYNGAISEGTVLAIGKCYQFVEGSDELTIVNYSDIVIK